MYFYPNEENDSFEDELFYNIKSSKLTGNTEDCYLMLEEYKDKFLKNNINPYYAYNNNFRGYNNNSYFNEIEYRIIENITSALHILKYNKRLRLVPKNYLRRFYHINYLRYFKTVNYYCGFNKLIIEFYGKYSSNALLIVNPLESIIDDNMYSFVLAFRTLNNLRGEVYTYLLEYDYNDILNKDIIDSLKNNNIFISNEFEKYIKNTNNIFPIEKNGIIQNNYFKFDKDNILNIFIYIFYYEKSLSISKDNFFNEIQDYFLISPYWLKDYKDFYDYSKLYKALKGYSNNNIHINYKNLDGYILQISFNIKKSFSIERKSGIKMSIDDIIIKPTYIDNIEFYENCFIIDEKIIDMINAYEYLNEKISKTDHLIKIKIKVKNNYIYLINSKLISISIGKIDDNLIYIPICLLVYDTLGILDEEKKLVFSNEIKNYLRLRKCSETNKNMQTLIEDKKNEEIGNVIILKVDEFKSKENTENKNNSKLEELNEKINILEQKNKEKSDEIINLKKAKINNNENEKNEEKKRNIYNKRSPRFQKSPEKLEEELQKSNQRNKKLEEDLKEKNKEIYKLRNRSQDYEVSRISQFIPKKIYQKKNINKTELDDTKFKLEKMEKEKKSKEDELLKTKKILEENQKKINDLNESNKKKDIEINNLQKLSKNKENEKKNEKNDLNDENRKLKEDNLNIEKELENEKMFKDKLNKDNEALKQNEKVYKAKINEYEMKEKDAENFKKAKEEELEKKNKEIAEKEETFNNKISELENQKGKIEDEKNNLEKENKRIKEENQDLNKKK